MKNSDVFRKVSIERLSSPEQLDQLLQVVGPRSWMALGGFGLIILALVTWGVTGIVPTKVAGSGVLIRTGGVSNVVAVGSGRVVDIAIQPGEIFEAGQVVARIQLPDLEKQLRIAEARLEELKAQRDQEESLASAEARLRLTHLRKRRIAVQQRIEASREHVDWLQEKLVARQELVAEGLVTRQHLIDTRQQLRAAEQDIEQGQAELQQIEIERQTLSSEEKRRTTTRTFEINQQQRVVHQLRDEIRRKTRVISPNKGRAIELQVEPEELIAEGESILSFSRIGRDVKNLEAAVYVTARDGKKVSPGMTIQISPATVEPEKYGRMIGVVTYVSDYPATVDGMMQLLENEQLVGALSVDGAPYEVHADILPALDTESGYRWTSSKGPPTEIQTGTICDAEITVSTRRPVELVLPVFRQTTGS